MLPFDTGVCILQGLDETPLTYIETLPALKELAGELASASEVAVDLEAHSYRSFQGFCCLMQLSTRQADYLVDVLALRTSIGPCLGPVFANAKACSSSAHHSVYRAALWRGATCSESADYMLECPRAFAPWPICGMTLVCGFPIYMGGFWGQQQVSEAIY